MITKFPKNNIWKQSNYGNKFEDIVSSFNMDLIERYGSIKVSPRFLVNTDDSDSAALDVAPFAIIFNSARDDFHVGAGDNMFIGGDTPNDAFIIDAAAQTPSFETTSQPDLAYFNSLTYGMVAELTRLDADGSDWDTITSLTGATNGAPMIPFAGRLYYRIGTDKMGSINTSETPVAPTNTYALAINEPAHVIHCGRGGSDFIWLGTRTSLGKKAKVYKWNGSSTSVSDVFEIDAQGVLAMAILDNVPYILDSNGILRKFNGGSFVEVDRLPFKEGKPLKPLSGIVTSWLCHYNGMTSDRENIYLNLNTSYADGTTDESIPAGVWKYNKNVGLHHYASFGTTKSGGTITDYGAAKVDAVGAIALVKPDDSDSNGILLAGATIYTTASATKTAIFYNDTNDTLQKAGYFVTSRIFSDNITNAWQKIYARFRRFLNATDKIIIKARTKEDKSTEATITYVNTTSFTVLASAFTTNPVAGDEVEILQGVGAGRTAHITAVAGTTTLTITIDETITGATTQTAKARFQTWVKLGSYNAQNDDFCKFPIQSNQLGSSPWIQFKVWFLWTGENELYDLIIANKVAEAIE